MRHLRRSFSGARVGARGASRHEWFARIVRCTRWWPSVGNWRPRWRGKCGLGAQGRADYPAVGDWVAITARPAEGAATIHAVVPRRSCLARKVAGTTTDEQILAANVDTVFLVAGLDNDFSLRRLERYLAVVWESGATPVVLLNKADLCADVDGALEEAASAAPGVTVLAVSAADGSGLEQIRPYFAVGRTVVFLGSSGVGKSTLANALMGDQVQATGGLRRGDGKGRHTTTSRELILMPQGGMVIDTPGLREVQLWGDEQTLSETFEDVEQIIASCRFSDCKHGSEPGCQVRRALQAGELDAGRWQNYLKLQKELRHLDRRRLSEERRQRSKQIAVWSRKHHREKYGI
jgi:ribosome biogenesis GTPase / thiamine phosphate phosphatase